jgi:hypothetical protein
MDETGNQAQRQNDGPDEAFERDVETRVEEVMGLAEKGDEVDCVYEKRDYELRR